MKQAYIFSREEWPLLDTSFKNCFHEDQKRLNSLHPTINDCNFRRFLWEERGFPVFIVLNYLTTDVHKKFRILPGLNYPMPHHRPNVSKYQKPPFIQKVYRVHVLSYHFDNCRALATAVRSVAPKLMPA